MMIRDGVFRKSGDSDTGGCVEVAAMPGGGVHVRDTKNRESGTQEYTDHEWRAFIAGAKRGEFDLPE
jgi:Domain of unknown function (DUF397)